MENLFHFNPDIYTYIVLPTLIFMARICDQTIGTLRLIFLSKEYKLIAPVLGFFEVIIWVLAIGEIINRFNPHAFYTIEDVKTVHEGIFRPVHKRRIWNKVSLKKAK